MENLEKIMSELKSMDSSKRKELLSTLENAMSREQQQKLKKMLYADNSRKQLEKELEAVDVQTVLNSLSSSKELEHALSRDDIKQKLNDILG